MVLVLSFAVAIQQDLQMLLECLDLF